MSQLFSPIKLANLELANRIQIAPMCQYSADDGSMTDWHMAHLGMLSNCGAGLVIVEAFDMNLWLAARNLPNVAVLEAQLIDPVSLVGAEKIIVTAPALKIVEERLK